MLFLRDQARGAALATVALTRARQDHILGATPGCARRHHHMFGGKGSGKFDTVRHRRAEVLARCVPGRGSHRSITALSSPEASIGSSRRRSNALAVTVAARAPRSRTKGTRYVRSISECIPTARDLSAAGCVERLGRTRHATLRIDRLEDDEKIEARAKYGGLSMWRAGGMGAAGLFDAFRPEIPGPRRRTGAVRGRGARAGVDHNCHGVSLPV